MAIKGSAASASLFKFPYLRKNIQGDAPQV